MSGGGGSLFQMPAVAENELEGQLFLPPGFRFHPRDDEVIEDYLAIKIENPNFTTIAMGDVDLNKCEPWELPRMAKMGQKEWYFFCQKDMKYPTGTRANRATKHGYWKATGKDKEIYSVKTVGNMKKKVLVGMKKTLVFYTGRAPKGVKTNWVMHEFRLEGASKDSAGSKITARDEWVVCRVNEKKNSIVHKGSQLAEADPSSPDQAAESEPSSTLHQTAGTDLSSSYNPVNGVSTTSYQAVKMDPSSSFDDLDIIDLYANPNFCYENDMSSSRFTTNFATSSTATNMPDHFLNFSGMPGTMTQPNTVLFNPNNYSSSNQFGANQSFNGNLGYEAYDSFRIRGQGATNSSYAPMNDFNSYQ